MPKNYLFWLGALALAACHYDPVVPEGVVPCQENGDCTAGYRCKRKPNSNESVCCKTVTCGFTETEPEPTPDAAPPRDSAAPDKPAPAPDAAKDAAPDTGLDVAPDVAVDGPAADVADDVGPDLAPDLAPDVSPDTAPACPPSRGGPAMVRADSFCIDSTEVTNEQYTAFLTDKASDVSGQPTACKWNTTFLPSTEGVTWPFLKGREKFPVGNVDWCDAFMFCKWAGKRLCGKVGGGRLTSVAAAAGLMGQWFNACTNGGRSSYAYGMTLQRSRCNTDAPTDAAMYVEEVAHRPACEGGYPGLFDMSGNMEEWVDGCDKDSGSADNCAIAGNAAFTGDLTADDLTCHGSVFGGPRNTRYYQLGFRCCAD